MPTAVKQADLFAGEAPRTELVDEAAPPLQVPARRVRGTVSPRRKSAPADDFVQAIERLAANPAIDPDKLERLIAMQERIMAHRAAAEFEQAFNAMQQDLPTIDQNGVIRIPETPDRPFAKNEDIQEAVRPILAQHGFTLRFKTTFPPMDSGGGILTVGILSHVGGHRETSEFRAAPDDSGKKNKIQAIGSTRSYGRRYTTIDLLNIVSRAPADRDDDGEGAGDGAGSRRSGPKPAQRRSQAAPPATQPASRPAAPQAATGSAPAGKAKTPAPAAETATEAARPAGEPATAGKVKSVTMQGDAAMIELETGFVCGTRNAELIQAMRRHKDSGAVVSLHCRPSAIDPKKYVPVLEEIELGRA